MVSPIMATVKSINDMILNHVLVDVDVNINANLQTYLAYPIMLNGEEGRLEVLVVDNHWTSLMHIQLLPDEENAKQEVGYIAGELNKVFEGASSNLHITKYTLTITNLVHNVKDVRHISSLDVSELGYASKFYEQQIKEIYNLLINRVRGNTHDN